MNLPRERSKEFQSFGATTEKSQAWVPTCVASVGEGTQSRAPEDDLSGLIDSYGSRLNRALVQYKHPGSHTRYTYFYSILLVREITASSLTR